MHVKLPRSFGFYQTQRSYAIPPNLEKGGCVKPQDKLASAPFEERRFEEIAEDMLRVLEFGDNSQLTLRYYELELCPS